MISCTQTTSVGDLLKVNKYSLANKFYRERIICDYMNNIAIGNLMMMAKFFLAFYFITLILYHYLTRDVKAKMDKISAKNSIAVSNKLYELKQEGNRKAKFTYIVYILCIINITLALGLFLIARFG